MVTVAAVLSKVTETLAKSPDKEQLADYLSHALDFPLESIRDDAHLAAAIDKINELIDRPELSAGEEMYLYALTDLVELYESEHIEIPEVSGIDVLRHLMEAGGLKQRDLVPIFGSKSTVSAVLSGKRPLALSHIKGLSERFGLPADAFIERPPARDVAAPGKAEVGSGPPIP